jgi:hypothetical protein
MNRPSSSNASDQSRLLALLSIPVDYPPVAHRLHQCSPIVVGASDGSGHTRPASLRVYISSPVVTLIHLAP